MKLERSYIVVYRMDSTLVDFKDMRWERGNLSFLFDGHKLGTQSLLVMDHDAKVYQWIRDVSIIIAPSQCLAIHR